MVAVPSLPVMVVIMVATAIRVVPSVVAPAIIMVAAIVVMPSLVVLPMAVSVIAIDGRVGPTVVAVPTIVGVMTDPPASKINPDREPVAVVVAAAP